jgi:hypothetical protein
LLPILGGRDISFDPLALELAIGSLVVGCWNWYGTCFGVEDDVELRQRYRQELDVVFLSMQQAIFGHPLTPTEPERNLPNWTEESVRRWTTDRDLDSKLFIGAVACLQYVNAGLKRLYSSALRGGKRRKVLEGVVTKMEELRRNLKEISSRY